MLFKTRHLKPVATRHQLQGSIVYFFNSSDGRLFRAELQLTFNFMLPNDVDDDDDDHDRRVPKRIHEFFEFPVPEMFLGFGQELDWKFGGSFGDAERWPRASSGPRALSSSPKPWRTKNDEERGCAGIFVRTSASPGPGKGASRRVCVRCCVTARKLAFVNHEIASACIPSGKCFIDINETLNYTQQV